MKGTPAIYLGRIIEKNHFRTFIYGANGEKKLVESWEAFETAMQSGVWFATIEDAQAVKAIEVVVEKREEQVETSQLKPSKSKPTKPLNSNEPPFKAMKIPDDGMGFEVTDENR